MIASRRHSYEISPDVKLNVGDRVRVKTMDYFESLPSTWRTTWTAPNRTNKTQRCWRVRMTNHFSRWFFNDMKYLCGQVLTVDSVTTRTNLNYDPKNPHWPKEFYEYKLVGIPYSDEYVFVNTMLERVYDD